MRFLLISDTHERLAVIDELADRFRADAVIHAGDFGFFDNGSFQRLSDRELLVWTEMQLCKCFLDLRFEIKRCIHRPFALD